MRVTDPRSWLALVTGGFVLSFAARDLQRTSPGPLATVHGRLAELAADDGCSACHGGWTRSMQAACSACHEVVAAQLQAGLGLHGDLDPELAGNCATCHSDHHGERFALVDARAFRLAGVPDAEAFPHERVGFPMAGAHLELACDACHLQAFSEPLPEGGQRFGGLRAACVTCHAEVHVPSLGTRCDDCHGQGDWSGAPAFEHPADFPLLGAHDTGNCRACHERGGDHSLEAARSADRGGRKRACTDCHADPHRGDFLAGVAAALASASGASCAACHDAADGTFAHTDADAGRELHLASGFPLVSPHASVACAACHGSGPDPDPSTWLADPWSPVPHRSLPRPEDAFATRFPGRDAQDCAACHGDPHGGQFDGVAGPAACLDCHDATAFDPHGFDSEAHARLELPLEGAHGRSDCADCHPRPEAHVPRSFAGTPAECAACHSDVHGTGLRRAAVDEDLGAGSTCARCHGVEAFATDAQGGFDHDRWTAFPLLGSHAQAACESCHPRAAQPDALGRRFGRAAAPDAAGSLACGACHGDPHRGSFEPFARAAGEPAPDCVRCHSTVSFRSLPDSFDHDSWTGFALGDVHGDLDCAACHSPLARPEPDGRTWAAAAGTRCSDCHADPHGGQFDVAGASDCADCHAVARAGRGFAAASFDHGRTAFPLDDAHDHLACSACHGIEDIAGAPRPRYRPLGNTCRDCHGETRSRVRAPTRRRGNGGGR